MSLEKDKIDEFIHVVRHNSGYDFKDYSERSFMRRIDRVLVDTKLTMDELIQKARHDSVFLEQTVKNITVNTTELFRDPQVWQSLRFRILPRYEDQNTINIWHVGSSTGQEVYSMMILLHQMGLFDKAKIFATDLNTDVLEIAKKGEYKYRYNKEYLMNFDKVIKENPYNYDEYKNIPYSEYITIDKTRDLFAMKPFLTRKPIFRKHDIITEDNIFNTKFDIILCRNVLIYFNSQLQNKIFEFFHGHLFRNGSLILGAHESMLGTITAKYRKKGIAYIKK